MQQELQLTRLFTCACPSCLEPDQARAMKCQDEKCAGTITPKTTARVEEEDTVPHLVAQESLLGGARWSQKIV